MAVAWVSRVNYSPAYLAVAIGREHHTTRGIEEHGTFSVNLPGRDLVVPADYVGIYSGAEVDKAEVFDVFYGELQTAPMIEECPLNLECKVHHELNLGSHALIVGEIMEVHASEDCLTEGKPDVSKIQPIVYCSGAGRHYHSIGEILAPAYSAGMEIKIRM